MCVPRVPQGDEKSAKNAIAGYCNSVGSVACGTNGTRDFVDGNGDDPPAMATTTQLNEPVDVDVDAAVV
ncbi:hypothetical protein ACLKA6_000043 [Drosophila palustris]